MYYNDPDYNEPEETEPLLGRLSDSGYEFCDDARVWSKQVSFTRRVARRDHADGKVKAGDRYVVITDRHVIDETGKSYMTHRKLLVP